MIIIKNIANKLNVYQYMLIFLIILHITSAFFYDFGIKALLPAIIAALAASILDISINYIKTKTLAVPYSGIISGLFIGGLLTQNLAWYIYLIAGVIAVLSKYIIRLQQRQIFNPANFGVLLVSAIFGSPHSWWLSSSLPLVILFGVFIIWKLKRFDLAITFLISYFILSIMTDFSRMSSFNEIFLFAANSGVVLFFSMFMLIEPKTTPTGKKQRIIYGVLIAILFVAFSRITPIHDLPLALAVGNLFGFLMNKAKSISKPIKL